MKYFLLLLLPLSIYASKILSYNIYERSDRADVMITFDTPYSGTIKQSKSKNKIIIKLEDASIESSKIKKVNSNYLHSLTITPLKNETKIVAFTADNVKFIASKTSDAYGLRLRFTHKSTTKTLTQKSNLATDLSALPTKPDGQMSSSYYIVVAILIIGIIILFIVKKRILALPTSKKKESWLFNATKNQRSKEETPAPQELSQANIPTDMVSIRFQKAIDTANSVVMLDFGEESYLVLMGNSNILLDKFRDNKPTTQQEFNEILQERNQLLEDFLGTPEEQGFSRSDSSHKEPLQAYKERAASLIYADES